MTVYLFDPFLIDYSGHCFNYLEVVQHALKQRGANVILGGNELCYGRLKEHEVLPIFSKAVFNPVKHKMRHDITTVLRRILRIRPKNELYDFETDIEKIILSLKLSQNDTILINSLRPTHFLSLVKWINRQPKLTLPNFVIILHFTSSLSSHSGRVFKRAYREAFRLSREFERKIKIFADTDELVTEFTELGGSDILLAPIPIFLASASTNQIRQNLIASDGEKVVISFVGQARNDKGFHLLPDIAKQVQSQIATGKVCFKVQVDNAALKNKSNKRIVEQLISLNCETVAGNLNQEDYYNLLTKSDIILLPYVGEAYKSQSSGIFAEAMALGKIIVTHRNTWMGKQISNIRPTFGLNSCSELTEDLLYCVANYDIIKNEWESLSKVWIARNNDIDFIDQILGF